MIPIFCWGEDPLIGLFAAFFGRTILNLNVTWLVNSAAHLWGTRPYDKSMFPVENMVVSFLAVGEGWHNYHHAFPWDYRASELGTPLNLTGFFIDLFAKVGVIWDLKEATHNMVKSRVMRTGDQSHHTYGTSEGRSAVKTLFNIWEHPMNPTYNSIYSPKPKTLYNNGYALAESELKKSELDETILEKENEILMQKQYEEERMRHSDIGKYIVEKKEAAKIYGKLTKYLTTDINNQPDEFSSSESLNNSELTINNNVRERKFTKNDLNVTETISSL